MSALILSIRVELDDEETAQEVAYSIQQSLLRHPLYEPLRTGDTGVVVGPLGHSCGMWGVG